MKTIKFALLVLFFAAFVQNAASQTWSWARIASGTGDVRIEAITSDRESTVTALGFFKGTVNVSGRELTSYGDKDIIIIRYNEDGDTLWIKHIGSTGEDRAKDILTDENGNLYVTGSFSDNAYFDGRYLTSYHDGDMFLAKYAPDGDSIWIKTVGRGYNLDRGNDIALAGDEVHVIGFFDDTIMFESDTLVTNGYTSNFIASFDTDGNYICSMVLYSFHNNSRLNSISTAQDGGCLISGFFYDTIRFTDASETEYEYYSRSSGQPDIFLARIYPNKTLAWARTAGSTGEDQGMDARSDEEGNIYLTGYIDVPFANFDSTQTLQSSALISNGGFDIFMAKYNSQGRLIWKKGFGGKGEDLARRMDAFEDKIIFTGHFSDTIKTPEDTLATTGLTDNDTGFGLTNDGGDFISFSQIRGDGIDRGMGIVNDKLGNVYIGGFFRSSKLFVGNDTLFNVNPGQREGFVAKGVWPIKLAVTDQNNVSCKGESDGSVCVTPYYGDPPFNFDWFHDAELHDSCASGLAAGDYTVVVTDDIGGKDTLIVTITEPNYLKIDRIITPVSCYGGKNGAIDITVSGGTKPYSYNWNGTGVIAGNQDQINLAAGTYSVEVTDKNGCTLDSTFIVTQPTVLEITSIIPTPVSGAGAGDGSIDLTVAGGTEPYGYSWTGPNGYTNELDQDPSGLDGGTYYVTVTDANGCEATGQTTVYEPGLLIHTSQQTNILCAGESTGEIIVTPSGGVPFTGIHPYTYTWSHDGGHTDSIASDLPAGYYEIVITDQNSNKDTAKVTLTEPEELSNETYPHDVSCFGEGDGSIDCLPDGGILPYSILWNNGDTVFNPDGLGPGIYQGVITDSFGCLDTANAVILQPSNINVTPTVTHITCFGYRDGEICLDVSGGAGGYEYLWSNTYTTACIDYLFPGEYSYILTDANGCMKKDTIIIIEPTKVTGALTVKASCFGRSDGSIKVVASGGVPPYTYLWDDALAQTTDSAYNLSPNPYTVIITDDTGCDESYGATVTENSLVLATKDSTHDASCNGYADGGIFITTTGGTPPYSWLWSNGNTTEDLVNVVAGDYSVTATDAFNCSSPQSGTITEPVGIDIDQAEITTGILCNGDADGEITLSATGGAGGLEYSIDDGTTFQAGTSFTDLVAGSYITVVRDANSCLKYGDTLEITEPAALAFESVTFIPDTNSNSVGQIIAVVVADAGTPPYTFTIDGWTTTQDSGHFIGLAAGYYTVEVDDANNCGPVVNPTDSVQNITGIANIEFMHGITIFPNPSSGKFTMEIENSQSVDMTLEIINLRGQLIMKKELEYNGQPKYVETIDLSNNAKGTYFMRVNGLPVNIKIMLE